VLSSARPKIADYPFTTLVPNLGVVRRPSGDGTVFADIPGLIAGAAQGAGLGMDFLRHIERTKLLIHLVDCGASEPLADAITLLNELHAYGHGLPERPRITVLSKCELLNPEQQLEAQKILEAELNQKVLLISAATGNGLTSLLQAVWLELGIENP
jgi:GTP-binding protein